MRKIFPVLLTLITLLFIPAAPAIQAQGELEVLSQQVEYIFGGELIFQIQFDSPDLVSSLTLFVEAPGIPTFVGAVSLPSEDEGTFTYELAQRPLPAFSSISYSYQFTLENGAVVDSPSYAFTYLDNRFNWQELIDDPFKIYWYQGEITLAQEILDAAKQGRARILELLQQPEDPQPITLFIYSSEEDLQSSLTTIGQSWVSGHADPARGAVVVALPPAVNQPLEIQRLIPHELTHILLYRFMGAEYQYLPAWLSEGLASQMEAYSLPAYDLALQRAYAQRDLIPFAHICQAFPVDAELALLSYAQAESLIDYLQREYGLQALQSLISAYDQGVSCDRGVEIALGKTLQDLDKEWQRETFSKGTYLTYIYLLGGLLVILIIALAVFIALKMKGNLAEPDWDESETLEN